MIPFVCSIFAASKRCTGRDHSGSKAAAWDWSGAGMTKTAAVGSFHAACQIQNMPKMANPGFAFKTSGSEAHPTFFKGMGS